MGRQSARWRLLGAIGMAAFFAGAGGGWLSAAERPGATIGEATRGKAEAAEEAPPATAAPTLREESAYSGGLEITTPEPGTKLRGTARVKVDWENPLGYVIFRVDDRFAYATTPPFEMKWDTSSAADGSHVVAVDAYDASARYAGGASIGVTVENTISTPAEGVLLAVKFDEHDMMERTVSARGELGALRSDEALPAGFDVLEGELRADLSVSVMDAFYEGMSALVRSRLRAAALVTEGTSRSAPDVGRYVMLQVSRNGLALPDASAMSKPRLGLAEISLALRDFPVLPGDTWQSPIGLVCDLYTRRGVYVQGRHVFEGLRWYRGHECAVVSSSYSIPELPLYSQAVREAASLVGTGLTGMKVELTGARGGRGGRGGMRGGMGGEMRGGRARGGGAGGGRQGRAGTAGATARPGTPTELLSARLVDLQGTRRTYLTRQSGRILHTEDTILGQVEFRAAAQRVAALADGPFAVEMTGARGMRGGMGGGMGGMRGGMRGEGARGGAGGAQRGAAGGRAAGAQRPGAAAAGIIPPRLDYGFRLTTDLIVD
jgi:hypothetical protein